MDKNKNSVKTDNIKNNEQINSINSDFIKDLIAFSKKRNKRNPLNVKHQLNRSKDSVKNNKVNDLNFSNVLNSKKDQKSSDKQILKNKNINHYQLNNNNNLELEVSNIDYNNTTYNNGWNTKNIKTEFISNNDNYYNSPLSQYIRDSHHTKFGKIERYSPNKNIASNDEQKILRKNNTLTKFLFSKKRNDKQPNESKSILNMKISQVKESQLSGKILEPKEGHTKAIIHLLKSKRKSSENGKNNNEFFDNEDEIIKQNLEYLNDKQLFDEPKNIKNNNKNNICYSYHKKVCQNGSVNKKSFYKQNNQVNNINEKENPSYNKMYINKSNIHDLSMKNKLSKNNIKDKTNKNEYNKSTTPDKMQNTLKFMDINNNNIRKIKKTIQEHLSSEKLINTKSSPFKIQTNRLPKNIPFINRKIKEKHDLYLHNIRNDKNMRKINTNSPLLINQMRTYEKEYFVDDVFSNDNVGNLESTNININSYFSNDNNNDLDNSYSRNNSYSKDRYENIINNTNAYFYKINNNNTKVKHKNKGMLKSETNFSKFNKFKRKIVQQHNDNISNQTYVYNKQNNNILYNDKEEKFKLDHRNLTENNSFLYKNHLDKNHVENNKRKIYNNNNEYIISKRSNNNSPGIIYRKPKYKNNYLEISKSTNTINNNFIIYQDEINFFDKANNDNNFVNNLYNKEKNFVIKEKIPNKKNFFYYKYYLRHIKLPIINISYITKKSYYKYQNKKKDISPIQVLVCAICEFTKNNIIKFKNDMNNNINKSKSNIHKIYIKANNKNRNYKAIKQIKLEEKFDINKKINNELNPENKGKDYIFYKIKNNNRINNDIIFLLNIITPRNILNVENQLTKLIILSKNAFNLQKNEENSKLFINDIINNIKILIGILINKVINEKKYIELYIKLCNDLSKKYLNSINELIINKYINKNQDNNNNDKYNIIINFKTSLNISFIQKFDVLLLSNNNRESKQQLLNLINFVYLSIESDITSLDTFVEIIIKIFNQYNKTELIEYKYYFLYLNIYCILKIQNKHFKDKNDFVEKILSIIKQYNNNDKFPKYLERIKEQFIDTFSNKTEFEINNKEDLCTELIKEDINNYIFFIKNEGNNRSLKEYNFKIFKFTKKYELEEIIKSYINICVDSITKEDDLKYYKGYIQCIMEPLSIKLSLNKLRMFHNEILKILSEINYLFKNNIYVFEMIGYLIYLLIANELCDIEDMNIFINKDEETKNNICKIIKYIILSSGDNVKKYYEDFKNIDFFKNNNLFEKNIKSELNNIFSVLEN